MGYVSFERQHAARFEAMLAESTDSIRTPFEHRLQGLLSARIEDTHDDLAYWARRVAYTHDIHCTFVERVCAHIASEKTRCEERRKSEQPSLVNKHIERLDELSPLIAGDREALSHRLWDLRKVAIVERHDDLIAQVEKVCAAFKDPWPTMRTDVIAKLRTEKHKLEAIAASPCVDTSGNRLGPITLHPDSREQAA